MLPSLAGFALIVGCSADDPNSPDPRPEADASALDAAASDASVPRTDAGCEIIEQVGEITDAEAVAAAAPTPSGGTIVDGTYALVRLTYHAQPGPIVGLRQSTLQIRSGTWARVDTVGITPFRASGMLSQAGSTLDFATDCSEFDVPVFGPTSYTAEGDELRLYRPADPPAVEEAVYRRLR